MTSCAGTSATSDGQPSDQGSYVSSDNRRKYTSLISAPESTARTSGGGYSPARSRYASLDGTLASASLSIKTEEPSSATVQPTSDGLVYSSSRSSYSSTASFNSHPSSYGSYHSDSTYDSDPDLHPSSGSSNSTSDVVTDLGIQIGDDDTLDSFLTDLPRPLGLKARSTGAEIMDAPPSGITPSPLFSRYATSTGADDWSDGRSGSMSSASESPPPSSPFDDLISAISDTIGSTQTDLDTQEGAYR